MDTCFRIYTEWEDNLPTIVSTHFVGFTILTGIGYFRSKPEKSAVIEIITSKYNEPAVVVLAEKIRNTNNQECVLISVNSVTTYSV